MQRFRRADFMIYASIHDLLPSLKSIHPGTRPWGWRGRNDEQLACPLAFPQQPSRFHPVGLEEYAFRTPPSAQH